MNRTMKRIALPIGAAALLSSTGFAFMAANTVSVTSAGNGSNTIEGYTVSDVTYELVDDAFGNPYQASQESIQRVSFTLNKPATTVRAYIGSDASADDKQFPCSPAPGTNRWRCTPSNAGFGVLTTNADALHVVAAQ